MKLGVVIPVYNHGAAVGAVVAAVRRHGLTCLLVDDGSEPGCAAVIRELADDPAGDVRMLRLEPNCGKGAAMMAGFRALSAEGYSHALQIDADGQHDTDDLPRFVALAEQQPDAVICGVPIFDESVPKGRLYGRYATHVWVWINTLSFAIKDSMCGFRVYPLAATKALIESARIGARMDFDVEILVRLYWRDVDVINLPTRVRYPADGVSHFQLWRDNVMISRMHARLFFGMLWRAPRLLWRKVSR